MKTFPPSSMQQATFGKTGSMTFHSYSIDSTERRSIPFFIAVAAILSAVALSHVLKKCQMELPGAFGTPVSTMALYGLYYWLFDRFLWKLKPLQFLGITKARNLSGSWIATVTPAHGDAVSSGLATAATLDVQIHQNWSSLLIVGVGQLSRFRSITATLSTGEECVLSYEYINEPLASAPSTMHIHRGTTRLHFEPTRNEFVGDYYSGRDRQTSGTIRLQSK